MISVTQLVFGLLGLLALIFAVGGAAVALYFAFRLYRSFVAAVQDLTKSAERMSTVMQSFQAIEKSTVNFADLPKLIKGHARVAAAMTLEISKFRQATQAFAALIVNPGGKAVPAFTVPTEEERDREFQILQLMSDHPEHDRATAESLTDSALGRTEALGVE